MKIGYLMQAGVPDIREKPLTGPANHVKHVCDELIGLGHEVRLVAQLDEAFWVSDDLEHLRYIEVRRPLEWLWRLIEKGVRRLQSSFGLPYMAWFESRRFAQACCQELEGFDILYERMGWMGYGGSMAANRLKIPWVLEVNGDHLDELQSLGMSPQGGQRWLSITVMQRAIHRATHVVAVGEGWRKRFIERWAIAKERISVIENGSEMVEQLTKASLRVFQPASPSVDLSNGPNQCTARATSVNLVYIGGFEPWHGVTLLVEAYAEALPSIAPIAVVPHLILIGSGSELYKIQEIIARLDLHDDVTMTGYLSTDEMIPYLQNSDIGMCPYRGRANFSGLKILDYKAAGLVTIASGQGGEPAILEDDRTGRIVPPGDIAALTAAIIELAKDPEKRRRMGQAARADAEEYHRWQHTAMQLEHLFTRMSLS